MLYGMIVQSAVGTQAQQCSRGANSVQQQCLTITCAAGHVLPPLSCAPPPPSFSMCSWGRANTWEWAGGIGNSWRTYEVCGRVKMDTEWVGGWVRHWVWALGKAH